MCLANLKTAHNPTNGDRYELYSAWAVDRFNDRVKLRELGYANTWDCVPEQQAYWMNHYEDIACGVEFRRFTLSWTLSCTLTCCTLTCA
jgi:hypothetical protein